MTPLLSKNEDVGPNLQGMGASPQENGEDDMTRKIVLSVNNTPVEIDYFVQNFLDHTVSGMVSSLEGVMEIREIDVTMKGDRITIVLNGDLLPINDFVNDIFRNTLLGMLSTLKGVSDIHQLTLGIQR
jgi:hypothetical protein